MLDLAVRFLDSRVGRSISRQGAWLQARRWPWVLVGLGWGVGLGLLIVRAVS